VSHSDDPFGSRPLPRAKRSLGQNFLIDRNLQRKIVDSLEAGPDDEVLEIGPGPGALTRHLAPAVGRLVLVELDDELAAALRAEFAGNPDVSVVNADVLDVPLEQISRDPGALRVIGNIPYNITTPILFSLLERHPRPRRIVLMVQREVADRIAAPPGSKTYGALSVGVQAVASIQRVVNVSRNAFRPVPDVESAVIRIDPLDPPPLTPEVERSLRTLTRAAFGQRRKQFQRILRDAYHLTPEQVAGIEARTGFDLRQRPETFAPAQFVELTRVLEELSASS
jgi:16S rRNA (adenine1518-N6/adenine1519-N6)-dimethyltransferase